MSDKRVNIPEQIEIRGARVQNLKNVDVDIPLHRIVGIAGVSGSGKFSLALGVLYADGSRRYLESLSTYTRRRMTQAAERMAGKSSPHGHQRKPIKISRALPGAICKAAAEPDNTLA